ncbi:MAG: SDR family NAD(P)-dependent oxidoreductase [Trueperaceae bacterium]
MPSGERADRNATNPAPYAVVTGASSGIGRAIALTLAARGYRLALQGRDGRRLDATMEAALDLAERNHAGWGERDPNRAIASAYDELERDDAAFEARREAARARGEVVEDDAPPADLAEPSSGFGSFAEDDPELHLSHRNEGSPPPVLPYRVDLTNDDAVGRLVRRLLRVEEYEGTPPAVLIHSAGTIRLGAIADASVADLDVQYRVNVRAPFVLTQALLPALERARGHVVFVNSGAGLHANAEWGTYAASKFALKALADALRQEVAERGVRVTTVYPGRTATPMQEQVVAHEERAYQPERFVRPVDVAAQVAAVLAVPAPSVVSDLQIRPL